MSPFLKTGVTFASRHWEGTLPVMRENRNIVERTGATSELSYRRNLVGMLSGPDALLGLRLASSFSTPDVVIVISGDFGKGLGLTLGRGRLLVVKTDEYCSFRMYALPFESEMRTPSFFRGGTVQKYFLLLLMYDQNFLLVSGFCRGLSTLLCSILRRLSVYFQCSCRMSLWAFDLYSK